MHVGRVYLVDHLTLNNNVDLTLVTLAWQLFVATNSQLLTNGGGCLPLQPGSELILSLDTMSRTANSKSEINVHLAYLRSNGRMGRARVRCISGCFCQETVMDGFNPTATKSGALHLLHFQASQAPSCQLSVEVLSTSSSNGYMFKLIGAMVNEPLIPGNTTDENDWYKT